MNRYGCQSSAHVHYFKHVIQETQERGHKILIAASEKEMIKRLTIYKFDCIPGSIRAANILRDLHAPYVAHH